MFALRRNRPTPEPAPSLRIVPLGSISAASLGFLRLPLERTFGLPVQIAPAGVIRAEAAYSARQRQFDASKLMSALLERDGEAQGKVVGVFDEDLFAPGLTWVYGQAQLRGKAAVVSARRLAEDFHGRPRDDELRDMRLFTELSHEVGHAFGLVHCSERQCLMRWSASVEQIDEKGWDLCPDCEVRLERLRREDLPGVERVRPRWPRPVELAAG